MFVVMKSSDLRWFYIRGQVQETWVLNHPLMDLILDSTLDPLSLKIDFLNKRKFFLNGDHQDLIGKMTMPHQHHFNLSFLGPHPEVRGPCFVIYLNQTHIFE